MKYRNRKHPIGRLVGALVLTASAALAASMPGRAQAIQRLALVIGNDSYQNVQGLQNARADARAMKKVLEESGFQVTLLLDADDRAMKAAERTLKGRVAGGDEVIFYFSGHGVQLDTGNYLLPVDIHGQSQDQVKDEALGLQRVLDDLQDQKAGFSLAIIDACRDNPFKGTGRGIGSKGLAPSNPATGQMVFYSAGAGQEALDRLSDDDHDPNGLFTRVLLTQIRKEGVPVDRLLHMVRDEVVRLAKTVGHEQVPSLYDSSIGDFYFRPPAGGAGVARAQTAPAPEPEPSAPTAAGAPPAPAALDTAALSDAMTRAKWEYNVMTRAQREYNAHDYTAAFRDYSELAQQGVRQAEGTLGTMYFDGVGVAQDYALARQWLRKAADQGGPVAQFYLYRIYFEGKGVPQDNATALTWLRKAVDEGFAPAQYVLAQAYARGNIGLAKDPQEAIPLLRKAADQGMPEAQNDLGIAYKTGNGVSRDLAASVDLFHRAAEKGNTAAQLNLGEAYEFGIGVRQDYGTALGWYRQAADRGDSRAYKRVGQMYANGRGVPKDPAAAQYWMDKAVAQAAH